MLSFPREIGLRRSLCDTRQSYDSYINKMNGRTSCYTSLYHFERRDTKRPWKTDVESVVMDRAWWDFDLTEDYDIVQVKKDVATLLSKLEGDVRLVATGRGFHIHQFFKSPMRGTAIAKHIDRYQRTMAKGLKTLDGVGNPQKLTRIPDTYNPKRGRWAVNICKEGFMFDPLNYTIPDRPDPTLKAHDPFVGRKPCGTLNIPKWISDNPAPKKNIVAFTGNIGTNSTNIPIPPCLETHIYSDNPKHHVRVALAQHLAENIRWFASPSTLTNTQQSEVEEGVVQFIKQLKWRDFNEHVTRKHLKTILSHENSPSCSWFQERNMCTGPCWRNDGTLT